MKYLKTTKIETITTETGKELHCFKPDSPEDEMYFIREPESGTTYDEEIERLVTKMFIQDHNAKLGRLRYQFDLREMLTVNEVTSSIKADILKCMVELKSRKPFSDYGNYIDLRERVEAFNPIDTNEVKALKLKSDLTEYGFYDLTMVKNLFESQRKSLFELIFNNKTPYKIALFDYLEFLKPLKARFKTDAAMFKEIAGWFDENVTTIKKNIYAIRGGYSIDQSRYTAAQYSEIVEKDYKELK